MYPGPANDNARRRAEDLLATPGTDTDDRP
jgi:hypothetical protein